MSDTTTRSYHDSVANDASAEYLFDLISDITRTGQWSPVCSSCWWDNGAEAGQADVTAQDWPFP